MNKKPNFVFILTDDQGAWAMHCAGNKEIHTPNLDRIASLGMRFSNFFCASPVCSPARASIMTGRIPSQHGVHDWIRSGSLCRSELGEKQNNPYYKNETTAIPYLEGMTTYTDILAGNGYQCALAGKWHLGDSINPQHGFSKWFTIGRGGCPYYKPDMIENGQLYYDKRYVTNLITEKALCYLDEFAEQAAPFYISVHYTAPHDPWDEDQHPKEYVDLYRDCPFDSVPNLPVHPNQIDSAPYGTGETRLSLLRGYYAAITAMDAGIGRILDKLEQKNLLEDTIILFMADNGMNMGHHGIWGKGNGTFPFNLYDTAVKVPFLAAWKGHIPSNQVTESMKSQYDILQTILDLADIKDHLPENLPGRSFLDVLLTGKEKNNETIVVYDEYGPNRMVRTKDWKLIHRYPYGPDELYHLAVDSGEENNLIELPEYRSIREQLLNQLNHWFIQYADPKLDASREAVTGFGQLCRAGYYSDGKQTYSTSPKG